MPTILNTLKQTDPVMLPVLAKVWGVESDLAETSELIKALKKAMLDPIRVARILEQLDDRERSALQLIINTGMTKGRKLTAKMPEANFRMLYGDIRRMGVDQIQREDPVSNPQSIAEALYYRGLIAQGFENADTGTRKLIYIPDELIDHIRSLAAYQTTYADYDPEEEDDDALEASAPAEALLRTTERVIVEAVPAPPTVIPADTSLVDDLTTLLAYMVVHNPPLHGDTLTDTDREALAPFLISADPLRLRLMVELAASASMLELQGGRAAPRRAEARRWLQLARPLQVRTLAETWRNSALIYDMAYLPGLIIERNAGTFEHYRPQVARRVLDVLKEIAPASEWWPVAQFVRYIEVNNPDFQRPNGDYSSWYIRSAETEQYLTGRESWNAVEGALIYHYLLVPFHALGLLDIGHDDEQWYVRLTAYGRAYLGITPWPTPPEQREHIEIEADGTVRISRKVNRFDRFQIARFMTWVSGGMSYEYRLDAASIQRAVSQGISIAQIDSYLSRASGDRPLPPQLIRLLETWRSSVLATATLERLLVLRTTSEEVLTTLYETPSIRRFLGARLGATAVVVRSDDVAALRQALGEHGIQLDALNL